MDQYKPNQPNAAKLITSLRNTGYDSYAAIEDIIDNSIDADARIIKITVENNNKELRVIIADNGIGMDELVLDEALKLGSITDRNEVSDLGKFGMGLCTASISMSRKLEVITKQKESNCLYSCQDLDVIIKLNEFKKIGPIPAGKEEAELFGRLIGGEHGTVIVLSNIDHLSDNNVSQFASKLHKDIGRIYRKFINAKIKFFINEKEVQAIDPMMEDNSETKIYSDDTYEVPMGDGEKKQGTIRVKLVMLPDVNKELEKDMKMNIRSQGFYILRNQREIAHGQSLDVFVKDNYYNRIRGEIYFDATLDKEMGVRFSKDGVNPSQAVKDFLKRVLGGQFSSIKNSILEGKRSGEESILDHAGSEAVIAQRQKLLITPEVKIEKRKVKESAGDTVENTGKRVDHHDRKNFKESKLSPTGMGARFDTLAMGKESILYQAEQVGKIIVIRWNSDHPFYDRVMLANKDNKSLTNAIDYLIYALASAELMNTKDESVELMINLKSVMSTNLRALLS